MKKRIFGYYHVLMVNHYMDIVLEQLQLLKDSGLYDAVDKIYIGCLGGYEELKILMQHLRDYPKIIISEYSTNKELYEFHTLNILKEHADKSEEDYYLFYIHLKGVSFSEQENNAAFHGGNNWRRFMDEHTIKRWSENVSMLDLGYETCGTQLRPQREWRQHYSGTFFWSRSEYVKLLKQVHTLNMRDRFEAEFYICSAHPIAATLSQEFVDYYHPKQNTWLGGEDILVEKQIKQGRTLVHTLCWALTSDVERAVKSLYDLNDKNDFEHILVDLDFPLIKGNEIPEDIKKAKKKNSKILRSIADKYGSKYVKMPNVGVSQNWSTIAKEEEIGEGDVLICCDPDEHIHPQAYGWVKAIADIIRSNEKYGVVSLMMEEQFSELNKNNSEEKTINGIRIIEVHGALMWGQIGIDGGLIKKIGGIPYPKEYSIYGGLESAMLGYIDKLNYKWCFLPDYLFKHPEWDFNDLLRQWKHHILENSKNGQVTFENFLEMKKENKV